jgi:anti-sigma-K factor RskA
VEKQEIISSGILEIYAAGAASPEEAAQVEKWREQYPEIRDELLSIEKAMESYAMANAIAPDTSLKNKILGSLNTAPVQQSADKAKVVSISPAWRSIAAAALVLLICSAIMNVVHYNKYKDASAKYDESERTIAMQTEKLNNMDRDMGVVQNKYSQPVALKGMEGVAPDAAAKIFWMKNTGETYIDPSNLPAAPAGMQYQLWAIVDGKPVDGGMIPTKADGKYHILKMKSFGKVEAFAVTLETMGGHPEPKGKMYVSGKI